MFKDKKEKSKEAIIRQTIRDSRTSQQQLQILDQRLGFNIGAKKERLKLKR